MAKQNHIKTVVLPDSLRVATRELRGNHLNKQAFTKLANRKQRSLKK